MTLSTGSDESKRTEREVPVARPRLKICGVTRAEDIDCALDLGVDLIGLNFYEPSPRFVSVEQARVLRDRVGDRAQVVGVFVNLPTERVLEIEDRVGLDLLQFHGDEEADELHALAGRSLRAFKGSVLAEDPDTIDETGATAARERLLSSWGDFWGWLFDAPHDTLYGGSGESWSYGRLGKLQADDGGAPGHGGASVPRLFVAGGIRPENVLDVVARVPGLFAVDVCSGVESAPGIKDPNLMRELVARLETLKSQDTLEYDDGEAPS